MGMSPGEKRGTRGKKKGKKKKRGGGRSPCGRAINTSQQYLQMSLWKIHTSRHMCDVFVFILKPERKETCLNLCNTAIQCCKCVPGSSLASAQSHLTTRQSYRPSKPQLSASLVQCPCCGPPPTRGLAGFSLWLWSTWTSSVTRTPGALQITSSNPPARPLSQLPSPLTIQCLPLEWR